MTRQPVVDASATGLEGEQQRMARALVETASVINQSLNLGEVLELILKSIEKVVPHDAANVMLLEDGVAVMAAVSGYEKIGGNAVNILKQRRAIASVPNLRRMVETGESIVIPDTTRSAEWVHFASSSWIHSYLSTPIRRNHKTIGFINLNSSVTGFYGERHAERLRAFADQCAIAIENARLYEKAQEELAFRKQVELELQKANSELETRVEQRTAELRSMNEKLHMELQRRRQAERALENERASLTRRVEERTAELSAANAELAKVARLKDAFLANMSHELRTPLNAILNIGETLEEQVYGTLNEHQLKAVRTISESAAHLLSLINDILDLSKIGAGKFEILLDTVPVPALCGASLKLIENAARKKNIKVSLRLDPAVKTVWGDLRRLKQVLVNLLSNAVKFTPPGGNVGLVVEGDAEKRSACFSVWDTGIGIAEADIPRLFKPFAQLDNTLARKFEGTGLGLALSYHIAELHGGGLSVSSEVGKGSRFSVTLNWDGTPDGSMSVAEGGMPAGQPVGSALYSSTRQKIERMFYEFGIECASFYTGDPVLERAAEIAPNIVVINLPLDAACLKLARSFREDPRTRPIPVAIIQQEAGTLQEASIESAADLPQGVVLVSMAASRQEFRRMLRSTSLHGTASLVRRAVLINGKNGSLPEAETRILIVDDNETSIRPLRDFLTYRQYRVATAYSGAEAIEKAREFRPHLILMDIQMPGMDGIEAIQRIRADAILRDIPVIAVTALAMPGDRRRCIEAGANGYFCKPISLRDLIEVIQTHAGQFTAAA
jgi:signal transduction histidine kinase/CheY-like chemotaxis protein